MSTGWQEKLTAAAAQVAVPAGPDEDKALAYWQLGRLLHEQIGARATYGDQRIESLATRLGLLPRTLYRARRFYQRLPNLTTWSGLSWSHCRALVTLDDEVLMTRLLRMARDEHWSVRQLQEQIRLCQSGEDLTPRRGRPATCHLMPGPEPYLDLGFRLHLQLAALAPLTERARRLVDKTDHPIVVEWMLTDQGGDLRPVWGASHQRLYTYPLSAPQILTTNELEATLDLGPKLQQRRQLRLRGVPGSAATGSQGLEELVQGRALAITVHDPGPPTLVDLFALPDRTASPQQVVAHGDYVNLLLRDSDGSESVSK